LRTGVLSSAITIVNNTLSFTNLFLLDTSFSFLMIEYSISKNGFARVGRLQVAYDGTNVACNDSFTETGAVGVALQCIVSGGLQFQYTATNSTGDGSFKYSLRKWN
jgi:hypothetical protein